MRAYNKLIERVTAFAVTELGVEFSCRSWEQYEGGHVDPDTREVT